MWTEPLTPRTVNVGLYEFRVTVRDGTNKVVAHVRCAFNRDSKCGIFGGMEIDDATGGPRQKLRALVLLAREGMEHAASLGITQFETEAPPRMVAFVERMTGHTGAPNGSRIKFVGHPGLARLFAETETDATGEFLREPPVVEDL